MTNTEFDRHLSAAIRQEMPPLHAPDELLRRVRAAIRDTPPSRQEVPLRFRGAPRWLAVAASVMLLVLGGVAGWQIAMVRTADRAFADQILASHVRSLMPGHLTDVLSSDQHTVKPWFNGKLDYSPPVTDFADRGYPLVGGRLDYVGSRTVAALVYGRRKHFINVLVWPVNAGTSAMQMETRQGYHIRHWTGGGYTYWVVSDLGLAELDEFAGMLRQP